MNITFLGGTGTVTGSKYLVTSNGSSVLVDCGVFQGLKHLRKRNWDPLPVDVKSIDTVALTHAHIDHSGYVPLLVKNGFAGRIRCSVPTSDLCGILLPDSGHLQEEGAKYANKKGYSKHKPALPLYTEEDARTSLERFAPTETEKDAELAGGMTARFRFNGHILGSSILRVSDGRSSILFSGDLGRSKDAVMKSPPAPEAADYLVVESTYGNRTHADEDPRGELKRVITKTVERGGVVVIPSFAVGRAQIILYHIAQLKKARAIPDVPVFLNSPMATSATKLYLRYVDAHRLDDKGCDEMFRIVRFVRSVQESIDLNRRKKPAVIISASGMATGGRVVHHLKAFAPHEQNTILFAGFQAAGTRGERILSGA
ncbi:MAG: MBL fold metallo-hydrolase, partial [Planctomycetota bacterium]